ncbi:hypothetical protein [Bradyrhizobium sp.]|uniref:hypothetical protein n=1 Tax=Bradyrhizobium sp. TaxID=376 RepID=UPI0025B8C6A6|nr:hypothetical protein [Bradyrhizobium sp.]
MRAIEANLYPVIPYPYVQGNKEEVMSMSDYVHTSSRSRTFAESKAIESRLMFGFCYVLCLLRAAAMRLMPWRKHDAFGLSRDRESIFAEARSGAGTIVTSAFMGL